MGEIADMRIEGEMCPCGEYLGGSAGYPRYCSAQCQRDYGGGVERQPRRKIPRPLAAKCPHCGKTCKSVPGMEQHIRDKHPKGPTT